MKTLPRTKYAPIRSIKQLRNAINKGQKEFFITLNYGLKSSKYIDTTGKKFYVLNEIDGSEQKLTEKQLMDEGYTNIGKAMKKKAFFAYPK